MWVWWQLLCGMPLGVVVSGCCFFDCLVDFGVLADSAWFPGFRFLVCVVISVCFDLLCGCFVNCYSWVSGTFTVVVLWGRFLGVVECVISCGGLPIVVPCDVFGYAFAVVVTCDSCAWFGGILCVDLVGNCRVGFT